MKAKTARRCILIAYVLMGAWTIAALSYIVDEMLEQHTTFAELRAIKSASEDWQQRADSLVGRDRIGLLFVLQELQQDPGRSPDFRVGRALEKAGGRFHEPLEDTEKSAVRKIIQIARSAIMGYLDRTKTHFGPTELGFVELAVRLLERYHQDDCYPRVDESKFISVLTSITAGEEVPDEQASYLRANFDKAVSRIDRCVAGEALDLYPEERELLARAAPHCIDYAITKGGLADLRDALPGLEKIIAEPPGKPTERERAALEALLEDPNRAGSLPVGDLRACLARQNAQPDEEERTRLQDAFATLSDQFERAGRELFTQVEFSHLKQAAAGLDKLAGKSIAAPSGGESSTLKSVLEDARVEPTLPVEKLRAWLDGTPVIFTQDEKGRLLEGADRFFALYEDARARLAQLVVRFVERMRGAGERLIFYPAYDDPETREQSNAIEVIFALWKKIDDKVMMVEMVEICGTENERVRASMEDALAAVGDPAMVSLMRGIRRQKIDQALAAATKDRTKAERLDELNRANKIVRLCCIRVLGRIGSPRAKDELKLLVDDKDADIAAAAEEALRRME